MAHPRLAVGRFLRVARWCGSNTPAPVWGEITWVADHGDDCDVNIFCGQEAREVVAGQNMGRGVPIGGHLGDDVYTVYSLNRLPRYVLAALAKHKLLEGEN